MVLADIDEDGREQPGLCRQFTTVLEGRHVTDPEMRISVTDFTV
jgi:hypothetical protein